jgi:hypothetical protein
MEQLPLFELTYSLQIKAACVYDDGTEAVPRQLDQTNRSQNEPTNSAKKV